MTETRRLLFGLIVVWLGLATAQNAGARAKIGAVAVYDVIELSFTGPSFGPSDNPARDVDFWARFQHQSGGPTYQVHGFWDGDGRGGARGSVFKIRFCPTVAGNWNVIEVHSNRPELNGQKQGDFVSAIRSKLKGFWVVDDAGAGGRWYKRSDGSHQYVYGNTFYSFLSETSPYGESNGSDIASDVERNARYFKKLRFSPLGDLYPHPTDAPFFDDAGEQTYDGNYSHRPNPAWFHKRVDLAVRTAHGRDLIADLIMSGVDRPTTRAALQASHNGGDSAPYLKYIAARYGAYPNVWFCLINEYDIRTPHYTPAQIIDFGRKFKSFLAYPSPLSVHRNSGPWVTALNTAPSWNDHVIVQKKIRDLSEAADFMRSSFAAGGADKPVVDDELAYEGAGDKFSEEDTIESHLGAFLGGGYGTTGHKTAGGRGRAQEAQQISTGAAGTQLGLKLGQYFAGNFDAAAHTAADNLKWLREMIDAHVTFWKLAPVDPNGVFAGANPEFRAMGWEGREYVLGTDEAQKNLTANLPPGKWVVKRFDAIAKTEITLSAGANGAYRFDAPASRAVLFHFKRVAADGRSR